MSQVRFFSERMKDVLKESTTGLGEPIRGLSQVSPTSLANAIIPLTGIIPDIKKHADAAVAFASKSPQPQGVARDGVAAVHLLSQVWPSSQDSLYNIINSRLRDTGRDSLTPFFPLLKLLLSTLSHWSTTDDVMWRGVDRDLSGAFHVGQTVLWWGFGTGTTNRQALDNPSVLGDRRERTLFKLNTVKAHEVGKYTENGDPNEVLLAPGLFYEVTNITDGGDMYTWIVEMKDTMPMMKAMDFPI